MKQTFLFLLKYRNLDVIFENFTELRLYLWEE